MNQTISMPVWGLLVALLVAFVVAWVNAWFAMRLVRRNGHLSAPLERLDAEEARRRLKELRGEAGVLPEEFDGRMVE
jgi:hypothetical protein